MLLFQEIVLLFENLYVGELGQIEQNTFKPELYLFFPSLKENYGMLSTMSV